MRIITYILHQLTAILFTVVIWVLNDAYTGEFIILHTGMWIFIIFSILINLNALFFLISYIVQKRKNLEEKPSVKIQWYMLVSIIWNFILAVLLIIIMVYISILVIDYIGIALVLVLALPFIGFASLFIYNSVQILITKFKLKTFKPVKGLSVAGIVFFLLFTSFALKIAIYNPQWSEGVNHLAVFTKGEQAREYRIPSLLVLPGDILLAFSESRENAMLDWGDIDLVMKRSIDGGQTWSEITILKDEGTHTAGNPCPVFDNNTQTVWLPYCVDNKKVFVMNSTDLGLTWSEPREITMELNLDLPISTSQLDLLYGTGPGIGIQITSGRLVIPSYYFDDRGSHVIYSDDQGKTWQKGANLLVGEECQIIEAKNGSLCINCRTKEGYRYLAWSDDQGETWGTPYLDKNLPDIACMASFIRYTSNISGKDFLLFSNPTQGSRGHLTIRISFDEGETWNKSKIIYEGPSAYSQIAVLSDLTICIFFEQGKYDYRENINICFISYSWLISS